MEQFFNYQSLEHEQLDATELLLEILDNRYQIAEHIHNSPYGISSQISTRLAVDETYLSKGVMYSLPPAGKTMFHAKFSKLGQSHTVTDELLIEPAEAKSTRLIRRENTNRYMFFPGHGSSWTTGDEMLALDCLATLFSNPDNISLSVDMVDDFAKYFADRSNYTEDSRFYSQVEGDTVYSVRFDSYYHADKTDSTDRIEITRLAREHKGEPFTGTQLILAESSDGRLADGTKSSVESYLFLEKVAADSAEDAVKNLTNIEHLLFFKGEPKDAIREMSDDHKSEVLDTLDKLKRSTSLD